METLTIGDDLTVSRLGFGAMRLTDWTGAENPTEAIRVARRAVDLGVNFIDTADAYDLGANEELLAEALHPYPEDLVIATKAGHCRPSVGEWVPLGRPEYLRQQAELSLRRLRVERIDLFQLHRIDPQIPLADQIGALRRLQEDGKIRHIGLSEVSVAELEEARSIAPIVSVQNRYNLTDRASDDVLNHCEREGIAFIPWLPIARTLHTGILGQIAKKLDAAPAQVSLAWLLHRSPVMLPIPGTSSMEHLEENIAAAKISLPRAQYESLLAAT